jgi:flavin-dependent dehydrogenase
MAEAEVAIVGGGPAGAALAIRLATAGVEVAVFERQPEPRWNACGVYSTPLTRTGLASLGLSAAALDALIRPIDAMEVVSLRGPVVRLSHATAPACGLDRVRLERCLLDRARAAGARVAEGTAVRDLEPGRRATAFAAAGIDGVEHWRARVVAGADGPSSLVARAFGVHRPTRRGRHAGITVHRRDLSADEAVPGDGGDPTQAPATARMYLGRGWYCGIAPVPGARVNIGIVMSESGLRRLLALRGDPMAVVDWVVDQLPPEASQANQAPNTDQVRVALPLAHRVTRPAGPGYLLVGDAAGFLDPLSGEGIHRALVSAEMAADAIVGHRGGDPDALERYARQMRSRFATKDLLSWLLQVFLGRPELADYALSRMARREAIRDIFGLVLADQLPASRALTPRFLAGLLRP